MRQVDRTTRKGQVTSIPAPVGGLNALDALANMPATDAVAMTNYFPQPSSVSLRNGYTQNTTGFGAWVESLMPYTSPTAKKLFAASGTSFYDATAAGAVGGAVVTSLTNARWQSVNYTNSAHSWLYCVNGVDSPQLYNGSTWQAVTGISSPIAITGVTTSTLIDVCSFKSRLWFIQANTTLAWYLPTSAVGGAAVSFDFGNLFLLGGYLVTMVGVSISDAGGVDDYAAFISSEGEILLYRGTDPAQTSTWALVGRFNIGRPVGQRCTMRYGSDVIVICADGFYPISKALLTNRNELQDSLSYKILNLINNDVQSYSGNFGWQPILYPTGNKVIINVPQKENSIQYQYVMNTVTSAWCKFTGWNAACFAILADKLYFGGKTYVALADTGTSDNGGTITGDCTQAFNYFGNPGVQKRFTMVRPVLQVTGSVSPAIALEVDYSSVYPNTTATYSNGVN